MRTYYDATLAYPVPAGPTYAKRLRQFMSRIDGWLERQAIRSELESLDPRTLADIGINRGDFHSIVAGTYEQPRHK